MLKRLLKEADNVAKNVMDNHFGKIDSDKQFDTHDAAIIGLLEDMIGKTNSLIVLIENNSFNGTDALSRMILENYTFMKFILEKDTENRGESYYRSQKINDVKLFDSITQETLVGREVREFLGITKEKINNQFSDLTDEKYRNKLESQYLSVMNLKDKRSKWYNFNGKTNTFRDLCKYLKMEKDYVLFYQIFSNEVHGQQGNKFLKFEYDSVEIYRKSGELELHTKMVSSFIMEIVRLVYKYYNLNEDLKKFNTSIQINYAFMKL
ncbi:DUF5677 domain-containing protein [Peribacillus phoenicis]|uniref:DUF5677 domain-containing protein n=1 Tax=unclassified Peribacillus TaxID=2675266 RepID=UPI0039A15C31